MSIQSPPMLLELAGRSLLSNKSRAILDLEDLPIELFPPLFVEAFSRGHTEVLKKMVQAWPFTCLPLGALMRQPQPEMLRVALDGLDMLLAQQDHPRRWKLQVLDLRMLPLNFWRTWSGAVVDACSPEDIKRNGTLKLGSLRLLQLDSVQKVEVHCTWAPSTLAAYAPFLGQMRNLRKLLVSEVCMPAQTSPEEQERLLSQLTSQFLRMDCLRKLCMHAVLLLEGHLEQVLGHLKTPLESLSITKCPLSDSDWNYLSRCPNTSQLRHLDLRYIKLTNFSPEPLKILLETIAATLNRLDLEACEIVESQLQAILPALSHCSQLRTLCLFRNGISMSVLRDLLCHTARMSQLSKELYPAPLESYNAQGAIHPGRCSQLCAELTALLKDFRQPKVLIFYTLPCPRCGHMFIYNQGLNHCLDEIQCSLPPENRRVALRPLSEASFSECKFSLSLTDLFVIIFSGVAVSIAAIISSFFLATVVQCFQRCAPNKDAEDEDEDEDEDD
ncbi:PRAME family member 12-like [Urocitellus parryii]